MTDSDKARWTEDVLVALAQAKDSEGRYVRLGHSERKAVLLSTIEASEHLETTALKMFGGR